MIASRASWVAVLGGAVRYSDEQLREGYLCGRALARYGRNLLTGATTGIPYAAALGAKDGGSVVVGISPAANPDEHVERYCKPLSFIDLVIYSGMSFDGHALFILRSVGAAIFIGGEMGTLAEFAAGWIAGCPYLGVVRAAGGIAANLEDLASKIETTWGSTVICANGAVELVDDLCARMDRDDSSPCVEPESAVARTIAELRI